MLTFLFLARLNGWANPPDYLTNDYEPTDRAMGLASPFTEYATEEQVGWLGAFYSEPFLRYADFSLQPRLYYRSLETKSGVQQAFAAGGSLSFITGWWRETLQLGATAYTTQPVFAPSGAGNIGLLRPTGRPYVAVSAGFRNPVRRAIHRPAECRQCTIGNLNTQLYGPGSPQAMPTRYSLLSLPTQPMIYTVSGGRCRYGIRVSFCRR